MLAVLWRPPCWARPGTLAHHRGRRAGHPQLGPWFNTERLHGYLNDVPPAEGRSALARNEHACDATIASERRNRPGTHHRCHRIGPRAGLRNQTTEPPPRPGRFSAWLAKESVRDVYLAGTSADAATLLDKAIAGCTSDEVAEIPLARQDVEVMAHRHPRPPRHRCLQRANRRPQPARQEGQRCGHGFRSFDNYRLLVLLHAGGITWPDRPRPPRIRTRSPHSNA